MLASRDIEDLLNLIDGRAELCSELATAASEIKDYLATEITALLRNPSIVYAVQATARGEQGREQLIFERLEIIANLTSFHN